MKKPKGKLNVCGDYTRSNPVYNTVDYQQLSKYCDNLEHQIGEFEEALGGFKTNTPSSEELDCYVIHKSTFEKAEQILKKWKNIHP